MRKKPLAYLIQLGSSILGLITSLYLLVQHTRLKSGIQESASFCSFGRFADCDVVNASQYSEILGIPIASLGALFYFTALFLSLVSRQRWIFFLSIAGLTVDVALLAVQLFALKTFCLLCGLTYLSTVGILLTSLRLRKMPAFADLAWTPPLVGLSALAYAAFLGVLMLLPSHFRLQGQTFAMVENALAQFFNSWREMRTKEIPVKAGDGTFGRKDAPVKIVVFSDFECPHCRKAAFTLHAGLKPLRNQVLVVFKHFPLDSTCNPALKYQLHPHACQLARLAYCANAKGKFWEFHDTIFLDVGEEVSEGLEKVGEEISGILSKEEMDDCLKNEKSLANLGEDIKLGRELGIAGTPSVYINGKHVSIPLTVETLRRLVEIEATSAR